tara:strand:+ start:5455 stop:6084 length:630 start_codon:yes stop_codon:yes gene_type:complete
MGNKQFEIFIDGELYEAPEKTMTPNEILALAGLAVEEHYLVELKGKHQDSFEGKGDQDVHLHEKSKFISVFTGPTTVSFNGEDADEVKLVGAALFAVQLRAAGFDVVELPDNHIKFPYTVSVGNHSGLEVEMGFIIPADFPLTPPTGPHIGKKLHVIKSGGTHPTGGIHDSPKFGDGWQYWSRPHPKWKGENCNAVRYMSFINNLWATQ